jgi:hypothetical protein
LLLAGWFAAAVPCADAGACAPKSPVRCPCCAGEAHCACSGPEHQAPAQGAGLPAARTAPEHAAEMPVASSAGIVAAGVAVAPVPLVAPATTALPVYLSVCAFRC